MVQILLTLSDCLIRSFFFFCSAFNPETTINFYLLKLKNFLKMEDQVKEIDHVLKQLEKKRDEESGSVLQKLESKLSEIQKVEALAQSAVDNPTRQCV
jgi:glutamyl-tRNA reductase